MPRKHLGVRPGQRLERVQAVRIDESIGASPPVPLGVVVRITFPRQLWWELQHLNLREAVQLSSVSKRLCRRVRTCLQHEPPTNFAARLPPKPRPIRDVRVSSGGMAPHKRLYRHQPGSGWPLSWLLERVLRPSDHTAVWSQRPQEPGGPRGDRKTLR